MDSRYLLSPVHADTKALCSRSASILSAIWTLQSLAVKCSRKAGFLQPGSYKFHENRWLGRGSAGSHLPAARKAVDTTGESTQRRGVVNTPNIPVGNWPHAQREVVATGSQRMLLDQTLQSSLWFLCCFSSALWAFPVIVSCHVSEVEPQTCCLPHVLCRL